MGDFKTVDELILFLDKVDDTMLASNLSQQGIYILFRGTTRDGKEIFLGNSAAQSGGLSTSTDPVRALIFGIQSATKRSAKGVFYTIDPNTLNKVKLNAPQRGRYDLELEVVIQTGAKNLSKVAKEIPIDKVRQLINKELQIKIPAKLDRFEADIWLRETKKLTPKESYELYKLLLK